MPKELCVICSKVRGIRVCLIHHNLLICPVCCARTRTTQCEKCIYFLQAQKFKKEKPSPPQFTSPMPDANSEVMETAYQALEEAQKGNVRSAEKSLVTLLKTNPQVDMVQFGMGAICLLKNKEDEALRYFEKAIELNPYFAEAWFNKGVIHQKKLELPQMVEAYRKAIEFGDAAESYVRNAKKLLQEIARQVKKDTHLSLDDFLYASTIFSDAYNAMKQKDWESAITGFKMVLSMNPRHVQSHGNIGLCYSYIGKKQEALAHLDRALELDPKYEPAIINRKTVVQRVEGVKIPPDRIETVDY